MESGLALRSALEWTFHLLSITSVAWLAYKVARYGRREKDLPPGPPTAFCVGNIHLLPTTKPFLKLTEWAREFGEIYSLKVGHQTIVVLSGPSAVQTILEKNSRFTAARPPNWIIDEYLYSFDHLTFTSVPSTVTTFRRIYTNLLNKTTARQYQPVQEAESCQLLYEIMMNPADFFIGIKRFNFSQMLSVAFGVRAPRYATPSCVQFYHCLESVSELMAVGAAPPVDLIPLLRLLPERFAPWKKQVRELRDEEYDLSQGLLEMVQERIASNRKNGAFVEVAIEDQAALGLTDHQLRIFGLLSLQGGADTTACFLLSALLLLVGESAVQARAQKELDSVVGSHRLPTLDDVENLPYIRAIAKEVERLRPVLPITIPHQATQDLEYCGYRIPAGSTVMSNPWAMGRDPALFSNPEAFQPERFLTKSDTHSSNPDKSNTWAFGVGRRICPGMHTARNTIHLVLSRLLWGFDIVNLLDVNGLLIPVDTMNYAEGAIQCPNKFQCDFRIRSNVHAETIKNELRSAVPLLKLFEVGLSAEDTVFVQRQREAFPA